VTNAKEEICAPPEMPSAQFGMKLEASKGPVEVLVIDHVEKATAN
jgi:uncharacterized protein (TIGR03435 family)